MKNKNRVRGARSKRNGQTFENLIERSCIRYRTKGIADIKKTPEPMKPVGVINARRGWFKAVYEKKGQPDFTGTIKGGRSVLIEAKHSSVKRIEFERILPQQREDLENCTRLGGLALVVISFNLKDFYCIEWIDWIELKEKTGKKSLNDKDLAPYKVELVLGGIDFLDKFMKSGWV